MNELKLSDIQGLILRGYTMPLMRHIALRINDVAAAKRVLEHLVNGEPPQNVTDPQKDSSAPIPQITTASPWEVKPAFALNLGLTYEGLKALNLAADSLASFPEEFIAGAVGRAAHIGDVGANAPQNWKDKWATSEVHVLILLSAQYDEVLAAVTVTLRDLFERDDAFSELSCCDGANLPGSVAHFGYRDGFSQPNVEGAPFTGGPDPLPVAPTGAFLLGYESQNPGLTYSVPTPNELGFNGSFFAYRVLQQDCAAFAQFLEDNAPRVEMSVEKLAAKLCGRWRNGVPLALSPDTDTPEVPISLEQMNNFDYVPTANAPDADNDAKGLRCPLGAHIRRAHPRSSRIAGNGGHSHRLMRRGLPYGPPYDPLNPNDGIERGLLGIFICVSLRDQFEFVMAEWFNNGTFAPGLETDKDPITGNSVASQSRFVIPEANGAARISGFNQFITTRGGAYCFLPSITALKYLARSS